MAQFQVSANGTDFGIYEASTEQAARDACAVDAGYKSEAAMVETLESPSELVAVEVEAGAAALGIEICGNVNYVMERLGTDATAADAEQVLGLAERLATEQGDIDFDAINWLSNRTYDWAELWEAANGNVAALAKVRTEAGLPVLS